MGKEEYKGPEQINHASLSVETHGPVKKGTSAFNEPVNPERLVTASQHLTPEEKQKILNDVEDAYKKFTRQDMM